MNFIGLFKKTSNSIFSFGNEIARKRHGLAFRKTLGVYNYKLKKPGYFKNPHSVDLKLSEKLKTKGDIGNRNLYFIKKFNNKPYGVFTRKRHFNIQYSRMPNYDIPSTNGFYLRTFVTRRLPFILNNKPEDLSSTLNKEILHNVRTQVLLNDNPEVRRLGLELFETEFGKKVIKDFLKNKGDFLEKNFNYSKFNKGVTKNDFDKKKQSIKNQNHQEVDSNLQTEIKNDKTKRRKIKKIDLIENHSVSSNKEILENK